VRWSPSRSRTPPEADTTTSIEARIEAAEQVETVVPDGEDVQEVVGAACRGTPWRCSGTQVSQASETGFIR
jgi:hypothetical protein